MATTSAPPPVQPTAAQTAEPCIGAMGRIIGVLTSPKETFADIARAPRWLVVTLVLTFVGVAINVTLAQRVNWRSAVQERIERVPMAARSFEQMTPEQRAAAYTQAAEREKLQRYFRGAIGSCFMVFFFGLVYWGAYNLVDGLAVKFITAVSIVAHASIPLAVRELLAIPIALVKDGSEIDPDNVVASNLAAFLPSDAPLWQIAAGAGFDLFGLWLYALLIIGFAQVNPKKVSVAKSFWIVFSVWALFMLIGVGFAAAFS